jgi:hypothetical protein
LQPNRSFEAIDGLLCLTIYAAVVTHVAGSLEAGGLPGYPKRLLVEINGMK